MLVPEDMLREFQHVGVRLFSGVPDSLLKEFCACLQDRVPTNEHIIAANEGAAIGHAIGHYVATGAVPCVYLQNSGLGNAINPLVSAADEGVFAVPMILMIGWRGQPGTKDEPQHRFQGEITKELLALLQIPIVSVTAQSDVQAVVQDAHRQALSRSGPVAMLFSAKSFAPFDTHEANPASAKRNLPTREGALRIVCEQLPADAVVVASTGKLAREVFELRAPGIDAFRDLLVVGSMGHCHAIAFGAALGQPERQVWCLDGDGSLLMHMGTLGVTGTRALPNLNYVVFNNGAHESVGGQPTVGFEVDLVQVATGCGYTSASSVTTLDALPAALAAMTDTGGAAFLEVQISVGSRHDLGRPDVAPAQIKRNLMRFLGCGDAPSSNP